MHKEPCFRYTELPSPGEQNLKLHGYFQSSKYFQKYADTINDLLGITAQIDTVKSQFNELYNTGPVIAVHFRITGYRCIKDYHPLCTVEYYRRAMQYCSDQLPGAQFLIFCQPEDKEEVATMLQSIDTPASYQFVSDMKSLVDWEELLLMSSCQGHVIANSTFSWWGAYLAKSKVVTYPSVWFGPVAKSDASDLPMEEWHQIDVQDQDQDPLTGSGVSSSQ